MEKLASIKSPKELVAIGLVGLGVMTSFGLAKSPEARAARHKPDNAAAKKVAHVLKQQLLRHQPVAVEANRDIIWRAPGASNESRTQLAIPARVDGKRRYFQLDQEGHTMASVAVEPIPEQVSTIHSIASYDPLPGNVNHYQHIATKQAVIKLQSNGVPEAPVLLASGQYELVAASTTPYPDEPVATASRR